MAHIMIRDASVISDDDLTFCRALWATRWPDPPYGAADPAYRQERLFYVLCEAEGQRVGACYVLARTVTVDGAAQVVAWVADVLLPEEQRGRGLGTLMVRSAMQEAAARGIDMGMLFCTEVQRAFYERLGWRVLRGETVMQQFGAPQPTKPGDLVMVAPLTDAAEATVACWLTARVEVGIGQW